MKPFIYLQLLVAFLLLFVACKKESPGTVIPARQPKAPIAIAGNDTTIYLPFTAITLDGSRSLDPDSNILHYDWKPIVPGGQYILSYTGTIKTKVYGLNTVGDYAFELTVTDKDQLSSKDTFVITVAKPNCTLATQSYIFENLTWDYSWFMETFVYNPFFHLPGNSKILNIYIKRDNVTDWELVAPLLTTDYQKHEWDYVDKVLVIYPPSTNLKDDKPDVKIEYCQ